MNKDGLIYEMTEEQRAKLLGDLSEESATLREDAARFDGYKRAFENRQNPYVPCWPVPEQGVHGGGTTDDGTRASRNEARDALAAAERHTDEKPRDVLAESADRAEDEA